MNASEALDLFKVPLAMLVALLAVGAGAYVVITASSGSAAPALLDTVPSEAGMVVTAEGSAVEAETSRQVVDAVLNASSVREPSNYTELVALAGVGTGLDTGGLDRLVAYGTVEDDTEADRGYLGVLVESEWSEDGFVTAIENATTGEVGVAQQREYEGYTVYVVGEADNATWIGVIREGRYAVGTEAAVTGALDVVAGEAEPFDGDVRSSLERVDDGSVRFASAVPRSFLRENPTLNQQGLPIDFSAVKSVRVLAGSMQTEGANVSVRLRVRSNSTANAEQLTQQLDGFTSLRASFADSAAVSSALQSVTFEQDEQTVVVSYAGPEDQFVPTFRVLVDEPLGPIGGGGGFGRRVAPPGRG